MTTRFKLAAAIVGLVVATAATAGASAKPIDKTEARHAGAHKAQHAATTKIIVRKSHVRESHARIGMPVVYRAPLRAKLVKLVATKSAVRVIKRPTLQRQLVAHRIVVKQTVIR